MVSIDYAQDDRTSNFSASKLYTGNNKFLINWILEKKTLFINVTLFQKTIEGNLKV